MKTRADYRIIGRGMGGSCVMETILAVAAGDGGGLAPTIELVDDDALPDVDFVAVADNARRQKFLTTAHPLALIVQHPSASIAESAVLNAGVLVKAGAVVAEHTIVSRGAIVGEGAVVSHDCHLGACCHIQPGAVLCGAVIVGERATVGPGCTVTGKVRIGADAVIDSGLVIPMDVPCEARVVRGVDGKAQIRMSVRRQSHAEGK